MNWHHIKKLEYLIIKIQSFDEIFNIFGCFKKIIT